MVEKAARRLSEAKVATTSKRGPYAKTLQRRQQIIDRVLTVYHDLGADGTSLRAIAQSIGVTHPVLVHQFGSREELFLEVLSEYDERIRRHVADASTVEDYLRRGAEYSVSQPGLMALLSSMVSRALEGSSSERSRAHFSARYAQLRAEFADLLRDGQRQGAVRTDLSAEDLAVVALAAADGLTTQWLLDGSESFTAGVATVSRLLAPVPNEST